MKLNKNKLNMRCENSFHCSKCFQLKNGRKYFIFIEHTSFCRSQRCDIPCIAKKRKKQSIMSISLVQTIIDEIANSKYNIVLYGLGSSDFEYHKLNIPKNNLFQTTITNSYLYYSEHKPQALLLFARAYDYYDIREIIAAGNYDGIKTVICNKIKNNEYIRMAKMADENNLSIVFDCDHISENASKLEEILYNLKGYPNVTYRGKCKGTKPIVITKWSDLSVTYREEFHYFDITKKVSKSDFLKLIL